MKKVTTAIVAAIISISMVVPLAASAQTTTPSNASLIAVLTQLVQLLEQELQRFLSQRTAQTTTSTTVNTTVQQVQSNSPANFFATPTSSNTSQTVVNTPTSSGSNPTLGTGINSSQQVQAQDVTTGMGATATPGSVVAVTYVGKLQDGTVFDSSVQHGNVPLTFTLGEQGLIAGFQMGVNGMRVGGERLITVPPILGYGSQDVEDASGKVIIPANSTVIFDVQLVSVQGPNSSVGTPTTSTVQNDTATIDQGTLTPPSTAQFVPLTGEASNTSTVNVIVTMNGQTYYHSGPQPVTNGTWKTYAINEANGGTVAQFPAGNYTVSVFDANNNLLTSGTLVIMAPPVSSGTKPTCTITVSPQTAAFGQTVTLSWTSQNATSALWQPSLATVLTPSGTPALSGSASVVANLYGNPFVELNVSGPGGTNSCSAPISVSGDGPQTATIDQSSLTSTSETPILTGTVANVSVLDVDISINDQSATDFNPVISNGEWSGSPPVALQPGTYPVSVYAIGYGPILATGTLTVQ